MDLVAHPPVKGGLRIAAAVDDLGGKRCAVACCGKPLMDGRAIRAGVTDQAVTSHVDAMSLRRGGKLGIDCQRGQPSLARALLIRLAISFW